MWIIQMYMRKNPNFQQSKRTHNSIIYSNITIFPNASLPYICIYSTDFQSSLWVWKYHHLYVKDNKITKPQNKTQKEKENKARTYYEQYHIIYRYIGYDT